jgi:hypothetical protein
MSLKKLNVRPREAGQIRIGRPRGGPRSAPEALDHFEVLCPADDERGWKKDEFFHKKIGQPKPRELRVILPSNDPEEIFATSLNEYTAAKRLCFGDQETATVNVYMNDVCWIDDKGLLHVSRFKASRDPDGRPMWVEDCLKRALFNKDHLEEKLERLEREDKPIVWRCPGPKPIAIGPVECECEALGASCKPAGILRIILADHGGLGAVHVFRTTSWNTIRGIQATLDMLVDMSNGKALRGLPCLLKASFGKITDPQGKRRSKLLVHLELDGGSERLYEHAKAVLAGQETLAALPAGQRLALPEYDLEDPVVLDEMANEFPTDQAGEAEVAEVGDLLDDGPAEDQSAYVDPPGPDEPESQAPAKPEGNPEESEFTFE